MARLAGLGVPAGQSRWRTAWYLVHQPLWLVGQAFAVGVFVLSAVALYFGELAVVQPLLVVELILTLALREFRLHEAIPAKSWCAAGLVCLGLGAFLGLANFQGGTRVPGPAGGLPGRRRRSGVVGGREFCQAADRHVAPARLGGGVCPLAALRA